MSTNTELADIFRTFAAIMEIRGEPVFKAITFSKISRMLESLEYDIREAVEKGTLKGIAGVGPASQKIIEEFCNRGKSSDFESAVESIPVGLLDLMHIPGLGPKTISLFWKQGGVTSVEELSKAIDEGKLTGIKGVGEKKLQSIKQGLQMRTAAAERMGIGHAMPLAKSVLESVRGFEGVERAEIAGSLRRRRETIGDVDIVAACSDCTEGANIIRQFVKLPQVAKILGEGTTKGSVIVGEHLQIDLRVVPTECFGAALVYFTGSKDHNVLIRGRALDMGLTLNEWGLYEQKAFEKAPKKTGEPPKLKAIASKTEADVYKALKLEFIEPELREGRDEVKLAEKNALPELITRDDYRGDLHTHTVASDGGNTIEEMIEAAIERGYKFLAITDHSKSQVIANGLTAERLMSHVKAVRKAAAKYKEITVFTGTECDILVDGRMDYEDAILAELDLVVGSPHASLKQDAAKATDRIVRAIENRYVTIIGHPTGRLINRRAGLPLEFSRVFKAAAETGTALEINAGYPRLDINDIQTRGALAAGVKIAIDTDAHGTQEFDSIPMGIDVARRGGATKKDVINCWTVQELKAFIAKKRSQ